MYDRNCKQTIRCKTATKQSKYKKRILHTNPREFRLNSYRPFCLAVHCLLDFFLSEIANCLFLFERPMMNHRPCTCTQGYNVLSQVFRCCCCLFHLVCWVLFFVSKTFRTYDWLKTTSYRSIYRWCFLFRSCFAETDKKTELGKFIAISDVSFEFQQIDGVCHAIAYNYDNYYSSAAFEEMAHFFYSTQIMCAFFGLISANRERKNTPNDSVWHNKFGHQYWNEMHIVAIKTFSNSLELIISIGVWQSHEIESHFRIKYKGRCHNSGELHLNRHLSRSSVIWRGEKQQQQQHRQYINIIEI